MAETFWLVKNVGENNGSGKRSGVLGGPVGAGTEGTVPRMQIHAGVPRLSQD